MEDVLLFCFVLFCFTCDVVCGWWTSSSALRSTSDALEFDWLCSNCTAGCSFESPLRPPWPTGRVTWPNDNILSWFFGFVSSWLGLFAYRSLGTHCRRTLVSPLASKRRPITWQNKRVHWDYWFDWSLNRWIDEWDLNVVPGFVRWGSYCEMRDRVVADSPEKWTTGGADVP